VFETSLNLRPGSEIIFLGYIPVVYDLQIISLNYGVYIITIRIIISPEKILRFIMFFFVSTTSEIVMNSHLCTVFTDKSENNYLKNDH
jgi:hypothetical protein